MFQYINIFRRRIFEYRQNIKNKRFENFPAQIVIEPTNHCNLNCPFCLVGTQDRKDDTSHHNINRKRGFMDLALYKDLIQQGVALGLSRVLLHCQGEPLMHPKIIDMIKEAKRHHLFCSFFTNGQLINKELAQNLVAAKVDNIRFSVDGASEETYKKNRPGGSFSNVHENMKIMVDAARGSRTSLMWQFIAMRNNEEEIPLAKKMAQEMGIQFFIKSFAETDVSRAPQNNELRRNLKPKPCTDIYHQFIVFWDGKVVPCCYDLEGMHIVGDLKQQSLKDIWTSEKFRNFHSSVENVLNNSANEPLLCKSCLKWTLPNSGVAQE